MDAGFQRIPRRVKKAFLSKERGENNSLGNTRDLFKKSGDFKGTFHAQMSKINDRNGKDLTEAVEIKKWQEYAELHKKGLNVLNNHDGVVTHLDPDILECEVKWALESITMNKATGGDRISVKLFKNPKR